MNPAEPPPPAPSAESPWRVLRNILHQGVSNLCASLTGLVLLPLIVKTSGPATYGAFVVLGSILTLIFPAFALGSGYKCRRRLPAAASPAERAAIFVPNASFQLLAHAAACLALLACLRPLDRWLRAGASDLSAWVLPVVAVATYAMNLGDDYFRYSRRMGFISSAAIVRAAIAIGGVLLLGLGLRRLTLDALVLVQSASLLVPALFYWTRIARECPLAFRLDGWAQHLEDIRYGFPLASAVIIENVLSTSDRYILAGLLTPVHVGAYAAAASLGGVILLGPKIVSAVLPAALSHAVDSGRRDDAERMLNLALRYYALLAVPFVAGATLLAGPLLTVFADSEVAALGRWVVPLTAAGSVLYGYNWLVFNILFVDMDTRLWFRANVAAGVVATGVGLPLVAITRRIEPVAAGMLAGYAVATAIVESSRSRSWRIDLGLPLLLRRTGAAAAVMAATVWLLGRWEWLAAAPRATLALQVAAGLVVYGLALAALGGLPREELRALGRALRSRLA